MTDGPFKGMRPDPDSRKAVELLESPWVVCEKCGGGYRTGGWPWCKNGDPTTHWR